jgi:hypothetical protein
MSSEIRPWKRMAQRGKADDRKTRRQAVVHRSVTMSRTAPKRVDCSK